MLEKLRDSLTPSQRTYLSELLRFWGFLADLGFCDLTIALPFASGSKLGYVIAAQVRPATAQTVHPGDLVGMHFDLDPESPIGRCYQLSSVTSGDRIDGRSGRSVRSWFIPLKVDGSTFAVLIKDQLREQQRNPGELELTYVALFDRFVQMIVDGRFPYPPSDVEEAPRVGDGVCVLDGNERITFLSPNALSALHRLGCNNARVGENLSEIGLQIQAPARARTLGVPVLEEVERYLGVTVTFYCLPLFTADVVDGFVVLLRDVTDLRKRDRLLASKDAAIREVHHRVKNNLQTISSLLRLQGRRLANEDARQALTEAERRIRSIAVVHEFLSRDVSEQVEIEEIVRAIVRMVEEAKLPGREIVMQLEGEPGKLESGKVTPLAIVLAELIQNSLEHGIGDREELRIEVVFQRTLTHLLIEVTDNGVGFPEDLAAASADSLGLAIVRDLVNTQLEGSISFERPPGGGASVRIQVPLNATP
jgi:two-component sensor histidine kinase